MDYKSEFLFWKKNAGAEYAAELASIASDDTLMQEAFGGELAFGTAGISGIMGMGCNRLNEYTVRRTAQGIAKWLCGTKLPAVCAIGYDSRHNSRKFAEICAVALAEAGIKVWIYHELAPTPMLSYAVRELRCGCGIMITASHNAGQYNGIKCYGNDGCQMTDEPAAIVYNEIKATPYFVLARKAFETLVKDGLISFIGSDLWEAYYRRVFKEALRPQDVSEAGLHLVYTPLHGTGNKPVREMFRRLGVKYDIVSSQELPDGDFTTCEYPNPETDAALNESYLVADETHPDLILGTDPDCDRVAIAVPHKGKYVKLSGNELGCILLDYILCTRKDNCDLPENAECVKSIVSSPMADRIAEYYGCKTVNVLTGFKYIGGEILRLEELGEEEKFIFGFEESCGYLKGTYARDKDAVVASMLVCEAAAYAKKNNMDLVDYLDRLYDRFGCYSAKVQSIELQGVSAGETSKAFMLSIREHTPSQVGGYRVTATADYQTSVYHDLSGGNCSPILLPKSNVFTLEIGGSGKIIVRPSGTEPKIKLYYTAIGKDWGEAKAVLTALQEGMSSFLPK